MTLEDVFAKLSSHLIEGLMFHDQLSNYFGFLSLCGYEECHKYHYLSESLSYKRVNEYYLKHYNKLIREDKPNNPATIPQSWYKFTRQDVDTNTKKNAVQAGFTKWVTWERDTKSIYEALYKELVNLGNIDASLFVADLIRDVSEELVEAEQYLTDLETDGYNISDIIIWQSELVHKYTKKIAKLL